MAELIIGSFWTVAAVVAGFFVGFWVAVELVLKFAQVDKITGDWFL